MANEIFICYRREDTGGYAGRLYDRLEKEYGKRGLLFDVEAKGTAELLRDWVRRVAPEAAVALVLVGDQWVENKSARRRLHEDGDIVRLEVELFLQHEIPIIPVLIEGADVPRAQDLPESIRSLVDFKGYELGNSNWNSNLEVLLEAISTKTNSQVPVLFRGVAYWNAWRRRNPDIAPNLTFAQLAEEDLSGADLSFSNLHAANLNSAALVNCSLESANLADANLQRANLENSVLRNADLRGANLRKANLKNADLENADLRDAVLNEADLTATRLSSCRVYGVSVWDAALANALQDDLRLDAGTSVTTVDNIEMAVVVHLFLGGGRAIRDVFDTLGSKTVLILGRFGDQRKHVQQVLSEELRSRNYVPILYDFRQLTERDLTETLRTMAGLSRFIVADITKPASIPLELQMLVPDYRVPFVTILEKGEQPFSMFRDLWMKYEWVLEPVAYDSLEQLREFFAEGVIRRAEEMASKLRTDVRIS